MGSDDPVILEDPARVLPSQDGAEVVPSAVDPAANKAFQDTDADAGRRIVGTLIAPPRFQPKLATPELTVIMPVYNEVRTIDRIVRKVLTAPYRKELIIVDDGSADGTAERLEALARLPGVRVLTHECNRGKGAAIRTGLAQARGPYTIIQDADLEYDPADYPLLIETLRRGEGAVVYGSRYAHSENTLPISRFWVAVKLLNWAVRVLYGARLTDEATCYKAFHTDLLRSLNLRCERFEFCPEVTAKVLKAGHDIVEVPIRFQHRTVAEGKKIGWTDAMEAFWTLLKFRITD